MIELACREAVFHYNKHNLIDSTVPSWIIKTKGKTYMVEHVESSVPWSTKETPGSNHTKGSIKFKNVLLKIDNNNCASLSILTLKDVARIKHKEFTRILIMNKQLVTDFITNNNIRYSPLKEIRGRCGTKFYICDIQKPNDVTLMQLSIVQGDIPYSNFFRILQENEDYYKAYEDDDYLTELNSDLDADDLIEDEDEDAA